MEWTIMILVVVIAFMTVWIVDLLHRCISKDKANKIYEQRIVELDEYIARIENECDQADWWKSKGD